MTETVLLSAIYGGYDVPKPLPAELGCPAVLLTDDPDIPAPGWDVVDITDHVDGETLAEGMADDPRSTVAQLRHKYWKCHPFQAVPGADVVIWVDGSVEITDPRFVSRCLAALGNDEWSVVPHPYRNCIYTEAQFSATLARYDAETLRNQVEWYRRNGHPSRWGLFATGVSVRRNTPAVRTAGSVWWDEILTSHQDQLSLPWIMRRMQMQTPPLRWNANLGWCAGWGVHDGHHGATTIARHERGQ